MTLKHLVLALPFCLAVSNGFSQLRVDHVQKISNTHGGIGLTFGSQDRMGANVADIGDLDKDGVKDFLVGDPGDDDGGTDNGAVYVFFMKNDSTVKSKQKISATTGGLSSSFSSGANIFGISLASLGDLDGDGVTDVAVGAARSDNYAGSVYILFMKSDGTVKSTVVLNKSTTALSSYLSTGVFGYGLTSLGDLDSDGVTDLAVGAPGDNNSTGSVYILFMHSNGSIKSIQKITNNSGGFPNVLAANDRFGVKLANIGDIDGDGVVDLAAGAMGDNEVKTQGGAVYLLRMKTDGTVKSANKINTKANPITTGTNVYFGNGVSACPDLNGDGIKDLLVGSSFDNDGGTERGAFYALFLDNSGNVKSFQKFSALSDGLSSWLTVNQAHFGDGVTYLSSPAANTFRIVVGASWDNDGATQAGAFYFVDLKEHTSGVTEYNGNNFQFGVYPNPFSSELNVTYNLLEQANVSLRITDIFGRNIYQQSSMEGQGSHSMNLYTGEVYLKPGIYFLTFSCGTSTRIIKLVKE